MNYCDMCEYKCKKVKTMAKHLNTKHENYLTCDICGKMFSSTIMLKSNKDGTQEDVFEENCNEDNVGSVERSFAWSESNCWTSMCEDKQGIPGWWEEPQDVYLLSSCWSCAS